MTQQISGNNARFLNTPVILSEIMRVMEAKPDAVLALGGMSIKAAGRLLKGKKIPVLLAPVTDSYLKTLVQSYRRPGGNMTGVRAVLDSAKMVEWIRKVTPGAKTVFVPYTVSANDLKALTTATVGMTVVTPMLGSAEEAGAAVSRLSRGTVILVYPTNLGIAGFSPLATRMRIPVFSFMPSQIDEGALFTLHLDHAKIGKQTARMMGMIINGTSPVEIPVETAEFSVTISYKVAQSLGLELSDDLLVQADRIIR